MKLALTLATATLIAACGTPTPSSSEASSTDAMKRDADVVTVDLTYDGPLTLEGDKQTAIATFMYPNMCNVGEIGKDQIVLTVTSDATATISEATLDAIAGRVQLAEGRFFLEYHQGQDIASFTPNLQHKYVGNSIEYDLSNLTTYYVWAVGLKTVYGQTFAEIVEAASSAQGAPVSIELSYKEVCETL